MTLCTLLCRCSLLLGCLLPMMSVSAADIAPSKVATEASFASEGAKWDPTYYSTTVLAPKDGAAKFCSFQRGGVQTIYTSEALGASPLTPERAKHTPYFDQGIMVGFATGENYDYRNGPIVHKQRLLEGHLPLVVTDWDDKDTTSPLHYLSLIHI